jgi:hypothetical protein
VRTAAPRGKAVLRPHAYLRAEWLIWDVVRDAYTLTVREPLFGREACFPARG